MQTDECLTQECIYIHLLEEESFSGFLRSEFTTGTCEHDFVTITSLDSNHGPVCKLCKCHVETTSFNCTYTLRMDLIHIVSGIFIDYS